MFSSLSAAAGATIADSSSPHPLAAAAALNWHSLIEQHLTVSHDAASFPYMLDSVAALQATPAHVAAP
jgi:hypothetical protein